MKDSKVTIMPVQFLVDINTEQTNQMTSRCLTANVLVFKGSLQVKKRMVVGNRQAGVSTSEPTDLILFSHNHFRKSI